MQANLSYSLKKFDNSIKTDALNKVLEQKNLSLKKTNTGKKAQLPLASQVLQVLAINTWSLTLGSQNNQIKNTKIQEEILQIIASGQCASISLAYNENETQNKQTNPNQINSTLENTLKDSKPWDSLLLACFANIIDCAKKEHIPISYDALPKKMRALLDVELLQNDKAPPPKHSILENIGDMAIKIPASIRNSAEFLGEVTYALAKFCIGRASCSAKDIWQELYLCSVASLPIISLVSLLLGLILAFVSALQLQALGAELYVASLVSISMVRVMGPVLTGIVIAGRTGASYAATIGSMQVNEEVDALNTFGISPVEFLILPKVIALTIMMPFLTVYANFMGILGAFLVATLGMDISPSAFIENVQQMMVINSLWIGLFHSFVFGIVISLASCYQGLICGRSAESVGQATTFAVVNSIVGIIVATSIITIILSVN